MAGRPPLAIGTYGRIRTNDVIKPDGSKTVRAYCQFRDTDGVTRQISASGRTAAVAERVLRARLAERSTAAGETITPDTKIRVVAEEWFAAIQAQVDDGARAPGTGALYRAMLDRHVLDAVGSLSLREATTGRIDKALLKIRQRSGAPTAKSCRTVISGILKYAARHDAVTTNATQNTSPISTKPKKVPRALTPDECARWLKHLASDETAVHYDLVDLCGFMLAVGCRIGEALGVAWDEVDLQAGTVAIDWTVCRVKGKPLFRKRVKSDAGFRTLVLPGFAVAMLRRRAVELYVLKTGHLPHDELDAVGAAEGLGTSPVFPDSRGGLRDPSNTRRALRKARGGDEFAWVTSHVFRKTAATLLDNAGLSARQIADQLGHSRPSLTQDVYMARRVTDARAALALEQGLQVAFPMC